MEAWKTLEKRPAAWAKTLVGLGCLALLAGVGRGGGASAAALPPEVVAALRDYKADSGEVTALLARTVPALAENWLALPPGAVVEKGAPLTQTLGPKLGEQLDAKASLLPMVVYRKEDGRLPASFIIARYRKVTPDQIIYRLADRNANIKHPLMDQFLDLGPWQQIADSPWGEGATVRRHSALLALRMPFGAGLFGLRDSYAVNDLETVMLPSGIAILTYTSRAASPDEKQRFGVFKDKKDHERKLDDNYYEAREYRLGSLMIPEKDASGQMNTVHVYFVRIVPNLKPGSNLSGSGALARWIFNRGAQDAVIAPVQMIRDEIQRQMNK